jgi:uncharacterized CHY-type Zn-finger protein
MERLAHPVRGVGIDAQTRCAHYHSPVDIVAMKAKCCGVYYSCKDCHAALAGHPLAVWPRAQWSELGVLCGACGSELTIAAYMACESRCPACAARFNPNCRKHYRFYFEDPV